jgi:coproporphyrinogen III oxidase-like Fe-S oxidoreductase
LIQALLLPRIPRFDDIRKSINGIIFLGTPHAGGRGASAAVIVTNIFKLANIDLNQDLIKGLKRESLELFDTTRDFCAAVEETHVKVYTLYEGEKTVIGSWPVKKRILVRLFRVF